MFLLGVCRTGFGRGRRSAPVVVAATVQGIVDAIGRLVPGIVVAGLCHGFLNLVAAGLAGNKRYGQGMGIGIPLSAAGAGAGRGAGGASAAAGGAGGGAGGAAGSAFFSASSALPSSEMIRRMEARISSIDGSWVAFASFMTSSPEAPLPACNKEPRDALLHLLRHRAQPK